MRPPVPAPRPSHADVAQHRITRTYDRIAPVYDVYSAPMEVLGGRRRGRRLLSQVSGTVLEVGIGTGTNLAHYPDGLVLTAVDVAQRMLRRRVAAPPAAMSR